MFLGDPEDSTVFIHETVDFVCIATGYPIPNIVWIKDGEELNTYANEKYELLVEVFGNETEKNSTLIINEVEPDNEGLYWCKANNSLISPIEEVSVKAILDVFCKHCSSFIIILIMYSGKTIRNIILYSSLQKCMYSVVYLNLKCSVHLLKLISNNIFSFIPRSSRCFKWTNRLC